MHKLIHASAATRRLPQPSRAHTHAAMPRVQTRQMRTLYDSNLPVRDATTAVPKYSSAPQLRSPNRPHGLLPGHEAIVQRAQAKLLAPEERYVDTLQHRLITSLLNPLCYAHLASELCEMLALTGLHEDEAAQLAGHILGLLVENRPLPGIERDIRALIDTMMIAGHPELTVEVALQHQLMLKVEKRLMLLATHARNLPNVQGVGLDWGEAMLLHSAYSMESMHFIKDRLMPVPLPDKRSGATPEIEAGRCQAAFSLDMLHRAPDIDAGLRQIHNALQAGGRIYVLETVLNGPSDRDAERDRGRTLVHDFLLHLLLHPGKVPVNGNYLRLHQWPERLRQTGFTVCEVIDLGFDEACPGNREALYVAKKP